MTHEPTSTPGRLLKVLAVWLWCLSISSTAQTNAVKNATGRTVTVPFFAFGGHGDPVSGIQQSQIVLLEDKMTRPVAVVHDASEMPLRLGLLIDASNSAGYASLYRAEVLASGKLLSEVLRGAKDEVFVDPFDSASHESGFMDKEEFSHFKLTVGTGGATALFDAVRLACSNRLKTDTTKPERRVLILLSDGGDNQSQYSSEESIAAAQEAGVVIFTVSVGEVLPDSGRRILERLAHETGGEAFLNVGNVNKVFAKLGNQIQNMYSLTYEPAEHDNKGGLRSIELKPAGDKKIKLRAPKGCYITSPN